MGELSFQERELGMSTWSKLSTERSPQELSRPGNDRTNFRRNLARLVFFDCRASAIALSISSLSVAAREHKSSGPITSAFSDHIR